MKSQPSKYHVKEIIEDCECLWAVVTVGTEDFTLTVNTDFSLYVLNPDGSAKQDRETEFYDRFLNNTSLEFFGHSQILALENDIREACI